MALNKKQLINVTEQHKDWIKSVVDLAGRKGRPETNQTDIIRAVLDQAVIQDPETFLGHLDKIQKRAKMEDIARRKQAILDEEAALIKDVEAEEERQPSIR